jgi:propanediol dehydratase small subunit
MANEHKQHNGYTPEGYNGGSGQSARGTSEGEQTTNAASYPLSDRPDALKAGSGRTLDEITLDAAAQGELSAQDLQIGSETLLAQAEIARQAGFGELADNLTRAAELTAVPNEELLRMYEMLRPHRSTYVELQKLAVTLEEEYNAQATAAFVREAAQVYQMRNLLRRA